MTDTATITRDLSQISTEELRTELELRDTAAFIQEGLDLYHEVYAQLADLESEFLDLIQGSFPIRCDTSHGLFMAKEKMHEAVRLVMRELH